MSTFPTFRLYNEFFKKKDDEQVRCPEDMKWLREYLQKNNLKAYRVNISSSGQRNRNEDNEIKDWCIGEQLVMR
tara:strand:+ start:1960 stop:2181 length:222 start_codon:yes stop_codon:yes gene_type:complete